MSYSYKVLHLDKTSHNLKYKYNDSFTPTEITYHQTSNSAPAINERNYLNNRSDAVYVGFHLVVDESEAIECMPLNVNTWHSGDGSNGAGNTKSIGIEIARSTHSDENLRNKAIENGALLIANLMVKYKISMSKVYSHNQRSGKNCPHDIRGRYGETKFRNLIQQKYNELIAPQSQATSAIKVGDKIKVKISTTNYATGQVLPSWVKGSTYTVEKVDGSKVLLKEITSWVWTKDVDLVVASQPTESKPSFKEYKVKIICNSLTIREKADFNSKSVGTVSKNQVFTIIGESNGLLKLKSGAGWISANSKYVAKV